MLNFIIKWYHFIQVHYAGVNLRDVSKANGRILVTDVTKENIYGMDFSGINNRLEILSLLATNVNDQNGHWDTREESKVCPNEVSSTGYVCKSNLFSSEILDIGMCTLTSKLLRYL